MLTQLVLADRYERFELTYEGCHVFNPGSFRGSAYGWTTYYPATGHAERRCVGRSRATLTTQRIASELCITLCIRLKLLVHERREQHRACVPDFEQQLQVWVLHVRGEIGICLE